jgi:PhzF family phenazine biosynthesis protein
MAMTSSREVLRYTAFSDDPAGGNPAGVVLDASGMSAEEMLAVAAEVGYSETAFITAADGDDLDVRYFAPEAEVPFCGHATIAATVAWAAHHGVGPLRLTTQAGLVTVDVSEEGGLLTSTLTSVAPRVEPVSDEDLAEALAALGWSESDLDPELPPRVGYGGALHLVLGAATRERLARLDYDFNRLRALMETNSWITIQLVFRESPDVFHSRNPFPPGGVVEDPATGAAAAAFGAYLRALGLVEPPARVTIHQGVDMGRPSLLLVDIPPGADTGISVTGTAVPL